MEKLIAKLKEPKVMALVAIAAIAAILFVTTILSGGGGHGHSH